MDINLPTCWRSDIGRAPHGWWVGSGALTSTGSLPSSSTRKWRQSSQIHVDRLRHGTVERRLAMLYWPTSNISTLSNSHSGFQFSCWETIPRLSRRPKTFFQDAPYCTSALVNLLYMVSSMTNTLDQVHCIQRCNTQMHYVWNAKYFEISCHFVSVSNSPNLALCMLINLNHN